LCSAVVGSEGTQRKRTNERSKHSGIDSGTVAVAQAPVISALRFVGFGVQYHLSKAVVGVKTYPFNSISIQSAHSASYPRPIIIQRTFSETELIVEASFADDL
jgi:hypothetical protein